VIRTICDSEDPDYDWNRRWERDLEREPRPPIRVAPRRKQFRYWAGMSFRPVRRDGTNHGSAS